MEGIKMKWILLKFCEYGLKARLYCYKKKTVKTTIVLMIANLNE